ncbi:MAG: hypothetical protein GQ540_03685 [Lutibacter sp.]|uniref:NlpC/P60 family protein n=1 Tax=Lutibacter sp. TaxID=1925666 RepID=UPI0019EAF775|nr:NlpC/P60 family protein [Lutibacter sp.]NOR27614.1 hypothetical protein [Lutibacter sp.]
MKNLSKYIGIPFIDNGRTLEGCDCFGLVKLIYKEQFNIILPDYLYKDTNDIEAINDSLSVGKNMYEKVNSPLYGNLVLFNIVGMPMHIGFCLGHGKFLHVSNKSKTSCKDRILRWKNKIEGFYCYVR